MRRAGILIPLLLGLAATRAAADPALPPRQQFDLRLHDALFRGERPGDRGGHFFFVATIQRGPAPEIRVRGKGLDATVTVGERTVSFDGERIVLGSKR